MSKGWIIISALFNMISILECQLLAEVREKTIEMLPILVLGVMTETRPSRMSLSACFTSFEQVTSVVKEAKTQTVARNTAKNKY